jgi:hypothetical protein
MEKLVKLSVSPFTPSLEVVDKIVMKVHVPYSQDSVTIQINPNIQDYKDQADRPGIKVRQITYSTPTDQTQTLLFDFKTNNVHLATVENTTYNLKLMTIDKEQIHGQDFLFFEFLIAWG